MSRTTREENEKFLISKKRHRFGNSNVDSAPLSRQPELKKKDSREEAYGITECAIYSAKSVLVKAEEILKGPFGGGRAFTGLGHAPGTRVPPFLGLLRCPPQPCSHSACGPEKLLPGLHFQLLKILQVVPKHLRKSCQAFNFNE